MSYTTGFTIFGVGVIVGAAITVQLIILYNNHANRVMAKKVADMMIKDFERYHLPIDDRQVE